MMAPGFSISYLNGLEPLMRDCVQDFEDVLESKIRIGDGSAIVDMHDMTANLASVSKPLSYFCAR
jgi:hypothetical protein